MLSSGLRRCFLIWALLSGNFDHLLEVVGPVFPLRTACIGYQVIILVVGFFFLYYFCFKNDHLPFIALPSPEGTTWAIPTECCHSSRKPQVLCKMDVELHQWCGKVWYVVTSSGSMAAVWSSWWSRILNLGVPNTLLNLLLNPHTMQISTLVKFQCKPPKHMLEVVKS